jgi:8-oxo-dGTP pyrophosphatase MutT (NUDIX family)
MSKEFAAYSAVALIESPDAIIVHRRRGDLKEGTMAYAGKAQFLGGHRDKKGDQIEPAINAIIREMSEETNLGVLPKKDFEEYWQGPFEGQGKNKGEIVRRHVTCFHLGLTAAQALELELQESEGGELLYLLKEPEVIDGLIDQLTPFAHKMLSAFVRGRKPGL